MDKDKFLQFVTASGLGNKNLALSVAKSYSNESGKPLDKVLHDYAQKAANRNSLSTFTMATKLLRKVRKNNATN